MAVKYWLGTAAEVAQVSTVQITGFDAATTYTITIGNAFVEVQGNTDADTTASDLESALSASTHPYFSSLSYSVTTDTITITAAVAGIPFVATSSTTGGAGTIGAVTDVTSSQGPTDWNTPENWSDGLVPVATDDVIFSDSNVSVCFGLDQELIALKSITIEQNYTGRIGLDRTAFLTSVDGTVTDTTKTEYREDYLKVSCDILEIGKQTGVGSAVGSNRIKISNSNAGPNITRIYATASAGSENNLPPVRLLNTGALSDIYIRGGSVGIAVDEPAEVSSHQNIYLNGSNSRLNMGESASFATMVQTNGTSLVQSNSAVTSIELIAGSMTTEGQFNVANLTIQDGSLFPNHDLDAGVAITTLNINGGFVDGTRTSEPRTWTDVNINQGGSLRVNSDLVNITNLNEPLGDYTMTIG